MIIKICGLTKPEEAEYLNRNHVDMAGMVLFVPKSKRNITTTQAKAIQACLDSSIKTVAVVVSPTADQARQLEEAGFSYLQVHGELRKEVLEAVSIPILRAFNVTDMAQFEMYSGCDGIAGYVFDAQTPGSGKTFDWSLMQEIPRDGKLLFLAGGLNPENVGEAIALVQPDGVDVSSGVEYEDRPGKDGSKIDAFVKKARGGM